VRYSYNLDVVKYFYSTAEDDDKQGAMYQAVTNNRLEYVKFLHEQNPKFTTDEILAISVRCNYYDITEYLLDVGVRTKSNTAISWAVIDGNLEIVKLLYENDCVDTEKILDLYNGAKYVEVKNYLGVMINKK
jgi:ankyrin repeat protein